MLSLSTGLSFINVFAIISLIFIPIIDTIKIIRMLIIDYMNRN